MSKRAVVFGSSGQLGVELMRELRSRGYEAHGFERKAVDITDRELVEQRLAGLDPGVVFNAAAYNQVDVAEKEPQAAYLANALGVRSLALACRQVDARLVHFSTDYVFDGSGDRPWREDDAPRPLSAYGASKLAGENEIRAAGGAFLIVRSSWVYSATGKNFLRTISGLARERKELRIVADQIGAPTSAALIGDVVTGMLAGGCDALRERCKRSGGVVHMAASGEVSWHGFASAIVEGLKARGLKLAIEQVVPISTDQYPTKAQRPRNSRLNLTRLQSVFDITPPSWQDALSPELNHLAREFGSAQSGG